MVKESYKRHSQSLHENEHEIDNLQSQLEKAEKERGGYEQRLTEKKIALEEKIGEKEHLTGEVLRLNGVLGEVTEECEKILEGEALRVAKRLTENARV